jgi:hypothetical protein
VAEVLPPSRAELRLLDSLLRHKVRFMVVGLSAAALQGAPVATEDTQAANRPKDQRVIPVLQNTLRTLQIKKARRKKAP